MEVKHLTSYNVTFDLYESSGEPGNMLMWSLALASEDQAPTLDFFQGVWQTWVSRPADYVHMKALWHAHSTAIQCFLCAEARCEQSPFVVHTRPIICLLYEKLHLDMHPVLAPGRQLRIVRLGG